MCSLRLIPHSSSVYIFFVIYRLLRHDINHVSRLGQSLTLSTPMLFHMINLQTEVHPKPYYTVWLLKKMKVDHQVKIPIMIWTYFETVLCATSASHYY